MRTKTAPAHDGGHVRMPDEWTREVPCGGSAHEVASCSGAGCQDDCTCAVGASRIGAGSRDWRPFALQKRYLWGRRREVLRSRVSQRHGASP